MKHLAQLGILLVICAAGILATDALFTVRETDQVILTQFGSPVGDPITDPGLKFKVPFIQKVNRLEKRVLEWDGQPNPQGMPTKDKTYIVVDSYARWRIGDPLLYFERLKDTRSALSRLDDILGSETRTTISSHNLVEVIRSTKGRVAEVSDELATTDEDSGLKPIQDGRSKLEAEVQQRADTKLADMGIELLDIRFKRVNYRKEVEVNIYDRMISERQRIAERIRSEGQGEANRILGLKAKELLQIESEAYKQVQIIRGEADAEATSIYASAFNQSPEAVAFYEFMRTMEIYQNVIGRDTTMILSTDSDLFQYLKGVEPQNRKDFSVPSVDPELPLFLRDP